MTTTGKIKWALYYAIIAANFLPIAALVWGGWSVALRCIVVVLVIKGTFLTAMHSVNPVQRRLAIRKVRSRLAKLKTV